MSSRLALDTTDTIFALASGTLPSAVAIVKLSGPQAFAIAGQLFRPAVSPTLHHEASFQYGKLHRKDGRKIDDIMLATFVSPRSPTGEDVVEFHCHGSVAVVHALETELIALRARRAQKGEFSYRAFLGGKKTLTELSELGDIFSAQEAYQLDRIYGRSEQSLWLEIESLREQLIRVQAILDTAVDFSEEYSLVVQSAKQPLERVIRGCSMVIQRYSALRQGAKAPRIVLAGRPNAGKSSLFNALLCRYRAIVHPTPGTTRDVIEEDIFLGGRRWKLVDTAGVRETTMEAEAEGIALAADCLEAAPYWLLVVDGAQGLFSTDRELLERYGEKPHRVLWNKSDRMEWNSPPAGLSPVTAVSAHSGEDVAKLWQVIEADIAEYGIFAEEGPLPLESQARQLEVARKGLVQALEGLNSGVAPEALAEDSRRALLQLEQVIGAVDEEQILDRVFSEFCVGK